MGRLIGNPREALRDIQQELQDDELRGLLVFAAAMIVIGTVFYMVVEGWDVVEAFYFTVTTLTTVGFGDLHPTNDLSRLFTALFALVGIGFILGLLNVVARRAALRVRRFGNGDNQPGDKQ